MLGFVSEKAYRQQVDNAILFLEGKNEKVMDNLAWQMDHASQQQEYEEAAYYRDVIVRLRKLQTQQSITGDKGNIDIIGASIEDEKAAVAVIFVRSGRMIGNKSFYLGRSAAVNESEVLNAFISQYYLSPLRGESVIDRVVASAKVQDKQFLQSALQQQLSKKIVISDRMLPQYKQWQTVASANASYALTLHESQQANVANKLAKLQSALLLPNPVQRIECFDISHTMGEATVASCVVYGQDGPIKKDYRRFNIKGHCARR